MGHHEGGFNRQVEVSFFLVLKRTNLLTWSVQAHFLWNF